MLLPQIKQAITKAPRYIAGISFSDRSIRYIEIERTRGDVLTISTYGAITVPYDVIQNNKVVDAVAFTESVRKLTSYIHTDAHIVIRDDSDETKAETLSVVGYGNVALKSGIDALRGVFTPWNVPTKRLCIFANFDTTYFLYVTDQETELLGTLSKEELFSPIIGQTIRSFLKETTDSHIILAGKYEDESYIEQIELYEFTVERTNIWQNLFDFSLYIPEIPQADSYEYTVPVGLLVAGLMEDLPIFAKGGTAKKKSVPKAVPVAEVKVKKTSPEKVPEKNKKQKNKKEKSVKKISEPMGLADLLVDVQPLTKLGEDKRKKSEKKQSKKYTKHL